MAQGICSIEDCEKTAVGRGWCPAHWWRWSKYGDPLAASPVRANKAIDHPDGTRTCSRCSNRKPLDQYDKVKTATLGRRSDCKACRSERMKAWYAANQPERVEMERARKAARPEVYRERDRVRNLSPHRRALHEVRTARRRARISGARVDPGVTRSNLRKQYGDKCFYCGVEMTFERYAKGTTRPGNLATLDHVHPVSKGGTHTWDNAVLACWTCNCSKRHSSLDEWLARR